jgi:hypothetical protein
MGRVDRPVGLKPSAIVVLEHVQTVEHLEEVQDASAAEQSTPRQLVTNAPCC